MEIEELRRLEALATVAPWDVNWGSRRRPIATAISTEYPGKVVYLCGATFDPTCIDDDLDFIIAMRNAPPSLLSRLAASEERCERLRRMALAHENLPYEMEGAGETMMRKSSEAQLELSEAREACTEAGDLAPRRPGKRREGI